MYDNNICLVLAGYINDNIFLEKSLIYYKSIIKNIIIITYECGIDINMLMKYIEKDNLILIKSNYACPGELTNYSYDSINKFYYDTSDMYYINNSIKRIFYTLSLLYKYMKIKKYEYIIRIRIDFLININKDIIFKSIENCKNKIIKLQLSEYHYGFTQDDHNDFIKSSYDKKNNFIIEHISQTKLLNNKNLSCFYLNDYIDISRYEVYYNFLDLHFNNINFFPNIYPNIESYYHGIYIYVKENLEENTILSLKQRENLVYKYYDFIDCNRINYIESNTPLENREKNIKNNTFHKCKVCIYSHKYFINNKNIFLKKSKIPCMFCLEEII
jgi:hypothetical protein